MLVNDANTEVSAVSLSVGVGSYHNPPEFQGLAHYLEHMLFLGTEKYPEPNELQSFLAENAGHTNAYTDRKSTRLNSSHVAISYAVFCLKKKKKQTNNLTQRTDSEQTPIRAQR